jgi:hypothetical protein
MIDAPGQACSGWRALPVPAGPLIYAEAGDTLQVGGGRGGRGGQEQSAAAVGASHELPLAVPAHASS